MEVTKISIGDRIKSVFLKDKIPFSQKTDVNWKAVRNCLFAAVGVGVVALLFMPAPKDESSFHDKMNSDSETQQTFSNSQDPTEQTLKQFNQGAIGGTRSRYNQGSGGGSAGGSDQNASMIIARDGQDARSQVPAGSRIAVRLTERAIVETTGLPVIGIVSRDFIHENTLAIPQGSKLFGSVSFGNDADRAQIEWRAVQLPDGRERQFSATSISQDGQSGIRGTIRSNGLKNTIGATLSRFVGAYAQGSMETGVLGAGPGGSENGLKNAIAQTANDQANALAEDLKKEKRWIEIEPQTEFFAVLTNNFAFRDPGATYGR